MTTEAYFTWISPRGETLDLHFDGDGPFILGNTFGGLLSTSSSAKSISATNQIGTTLIAHSVSSRRIILSILIAPNTHEEVWQRREELARYFAIRPQRAGEEPETGILRLNRPGLDPVEIVCTAEQSPIDVAWMAPTMLAVEVQLFCPSPLWRETLDTVNTLEAAGGVQFPITYPLEATSYNITRLVVNEGSVDVPFSLKIHGSCINPSFVNETTGERIRLNITIPEDQYVQIETAYGKKSVTLVDPAAGTETNVISSLDRTVSTLFQLQPGDNVLTFEAETNESGKSVIAYRQQYAGV